MKTGPLVAALAGVAALGGVIFAFSQGASPYATVEEAKKMVGRSVHLPGKIDQSTVNFSDQGFVTFQITDEKGGRILVKHQGAPPTNLDQAAQVVAIGAVDSEGTMNTDKLLVKCPSKYEAGSGEEMAPLSGRA
jgi:cytochrome c-type biogenesis protein CcmE